MSETIKHRLQVPMDKGGMRLDQVAAELFSDYSRARLQTWIKEEALKVDGRACKPREKLLGGEWLELEAELEAQERWLPEAIDLPIVYEDEHILILNKPAGLVVHPAAGHSEGTLLNALLHHAPELNVVPRAGIVHRLDKDTTGLMVVAKTIQAQTDLVEQLQERSMGREYEAVVQGVMTGGGTVDEHMGRHSRHRQKMAVVAEGSGKNAVTHYRVLEKFRAHTHIRCKLETGRTHQIRVHMAHIHYPLVGDPLYGGRNRLPKGCTPDLQDALRMFQRQALHAKRLELSHPATGEWMEWEVELPEDLKALLAALDEDRQGYDDYL
ncbi:23S rRNA pseudouridine(1911/1915/1917) synthase RluD [Pokkaliibacter sp. MBI-7]|uniref:23S rRNA pseudouridine(1911/1915/1917) synthase RluD n=1 Tax=Pokkaliibacter sp. MBI-7 TaxID=3040600 RepID=UPI00244B47D4|nr:23S rRNA pseudouridine(1911/1915/1917) synthase RluD [Pokkaliibacter sp. MBI-7]MDH2431472.1 23S rRNA pseudouridine(1911/1915/1917) synthase RluD [Pokkaliibacter sp. MBI-7]